VRDKNTAAYGNYMASANPAMSALATAAPMPTLSSMAATTQPYVQRNAGQGKLSSYESTLATMVQKNPSTITPIAMNTSTGVVPISKRFTQPTNTIQAISEKKMLYNKNSKKSSGLGPGAYGFSGTTGQASLKGKGQYGLQSRFSDAMNRMFTAMDLSGVGRPGVTDGFRSYSSQVDVKKRKGNLAATPGRSVHGLGLATDLDLSKAQLSWLRKNAGTYGVVNLPSESWHWQLDPSIWGGEWD
jgi:D-alanyl-D-alanine carboxypeptidase